MVPDRYSLGTLIGLPCFFIVTTIVLGVMVSGFRHAKSGGFYLVISATVVLAIMLPLCIIQWWPFDMSYHRYYRVDGEVTAVASRQISDGRSMSQRFVVVVDGRKLGVDDTRAALLKVGDEVHLLCKREYVYASVSGWACEWNGD